jgi:hypothetical protein
MTPLINSLFVGLFYLFAGLCGLVRHFLLEPGMANYPKAPKWLLNVFFAFSSVLIYAGLRFLWVWATGEGVRVPPGATGMGVLLAFATFVYKASMLYNVLRQRYPVAVWARLNRISDLVRCSPKNGSK